MIKHRAQRLELRGQIPHGVRFVLLCYRMAVKGYLGDPAELGFDLPLWDPAVSTLIQGTRPTLQLADWGERAHLGSSYRVFFRLPHWLGYSSLCSALTQEPWGRFCTPSQGGPTCWPHFNPQAGLQCWRGSPNHPGVPPQSCPPLSDP